MMLTDLIEALKAKPADAVSRVSLDYPHSYRGDYAQLAFRQKEAPQTAAEMLAVVESAHGQTFDGWKGGEYTMGDYSEVYLAEPGDCGDPITPATIGWMFDVKPEPKWSREWPTEPGWYWALGLDDDKPTAVEAYTHPNGWVALFVWGQSYNPGSFKKECPNVVYRRIEPPDLDAARRALEGGE